MLKFSAHLYQLIVAVTANLGSFLFGITIGWSSQLTPKIVDKDDFTHFWVTKNEYSMIVGCMALGGALSSAVSGIIRNRIGTKATLIGATSIGISGWTCIILSYNPEMIMIGRFLTGMSSGCYCFILPIYIAEISSNDIRGKTMSTFQIMLNVGILFAFTVGKFANFIEFNAICGLIPSILYCIAITFLPESPVYLISKNCDDNAFQSLRMLRNSQSEASHEMEILRKNQNYQLEQKKRSEPTSGIFSSKSTKKALIIIFMQFFFYQMSGVNALAFYTTQIFIDSGISIDPYAATISVSIGQLLITFLMIFLVDKFGRKFLLVISEFIMCLGMMALGTYFILEKEGFNIDDLRWIPVLCVSSCSIAFSFGLGPVTFILLGELFSLEAKKIAAPIGQVLNFLLIFVIGLTFLPLNDLIGSGLTFLMYSIFLLLALMFAVFIIPETKGLTLQQIQDLLEH